MYTYVHIPTYIHAYIYIILYMHTQRHTSRHTHTHANCQKTQKLIATQQQWQPACEECSPLILARH